MSDNLFEYVQHISDYLKPMSSVERLIGLYNFPIENPLKNFCKYVKPDTVWISELTNSVKNSKDFFSPTLKLREKIPGELEKADPASVVRIAEWIVKEWGGIPIGKDLSGCIEKAEKAHLESERNPENIAKFEFERIASWSKFLAFKYPREVSAARPPFGGRRLRNF